MEITVRNLQRKHAVDRKRLNLLAKHALTVLGIEEGQISVALVSDRRIRQLNRQYRFIDHPTDVLSFSQKEGEGGELNPEILGDVVISIETAVRQARAGRRRSEEEIDLLLVHGILHLAGFEHEGPKSEGEKMRRWKRKILRGWKG